MSRGHGWLGAALIGVLLCGATAWAAPEYKTKHVFLVVMDGVRWMDSFGDPQHQYIPHLYNDLRPLGTLFTHYYNRGITVTRQGHSTMASGTWQMVPNGGPRLTMPSLFEYLRDEKGIPPTKAWAIFGKGPYSFAAYSSHPAYGAKFAASEFHGGGPDDPVNEMSVMGDAGVLQKVKDVMKQDQPDFFFINFGYTDHSGHIAKSFAEYTDAIRNCDVQFYKLWEAIQADPYYKDTTTVLFVNDHGRHSSDYHSHGDHCDGCEHIMLLAIGPDIKQDYVSDKEALQIDLAPTIGELLDLQTPLAKGRVLTECMTQNLGLNKYEPVTDAGRKAMEMEKLADRDLVRVAADYALGKFKPAEVPANLDGELLMRGMLRAFADTKDQKYLDFVNQWLAAVKPEDADARAAVGNVYLDMTRPLPQEIKTRGAVLADGLLPLVTAPGDADRLTLLRAAGFLGMWSKVQGQARYAEPGDKLMRLALAKPAPKFDDTAANARELLPLVQAATVWPEGKELGKALTVSMFLSLRGMKEPGGRWDDPGLTALGTAGAAAAQKGKVLAEYARDKVQKELPAVIKEMTVEEANAFFGAQKHQTPRREIARVISQCGREGLPFSRDGLRYGVDAAGAYGDGSMLEQGGFLLAYSKLNWRYDGNTWPGPARLDVGRVNMVP
jgi:hypothetical protein